MWKVSLSAAVDIIEWATDFWNQRINEVFQFLITPPPDLFAESGGTSVVWNAIETIHGALMPVAISILAIMFLASVIKATTDIQQLQSGTTISRHAISFVIAYAVTRGSLFIFKAIIAVMQELVNATWQVTTGTTMKDKMLTSSKLPASIASQINNAGTWDKIIYVVVCFVAAIAIVIIAVKILLTVYARFFKIYMYVAVAAVPLTFFVSQEHRQTAWRFVKSFMALLLVGVLIIVACVIYYAVSDYFLPEGIISEPGPEVPIELPVYESEIQYLEEKGCTVDIYTIYEPRNAYPEYNPSNNYKLSRWLLDNGLYDEYTAIFGYYNQYQEIPSTPSTDRKAVFMYLGWRVFTMFILVATIQAADNISKEMISG
jgi:hypothetical protein